VSGNGFNASQTVSIVFDNQAVSSVSSDVHGVFPAPPSLSHRCTGRSYYLCQRCRGINTYRCFQHHTKINIINVRRPAGTVVSISGVGFSASKAVSFFIDTTSVTQTVTTDTAGKFANYNLTIPALPGGNHVIKVQDFGYTGAITANFRSILPLPCSPTRGNRLQGHYHR